MKEKEMDIRKVLKRFNYYSSWRNAMSEQERQTKLGDWVKQRIIIFSSLIINDGKIDKSVLGL